MSTPQENPRPSETPSARPAPARAGASGNPQNNPVDPALGTAALQAPWRMQYLESISAAEKSVAAAAQTTAQTAPGAGGGAGGESAGAASFLRDYWLAPGDDEKNHVIVRNAHGMVLLNGFPYANGHLLAALGEGRPRLLDYAPAQRAELWRLTDLAADILETALQPQGVNIGVNQGRAGGAGVPGHLHVHLVPRWAGDVNFITVVARVRVIPSSLELMAKRFREAWEQVKARW